MLKTKLLNSFWFKLILTGLFLVIAFRYAKVDISSFQKPELYRYLVLGIFSSIGVVFIQAIRWRTLIVSSVEENVPALKEFVKFILLGYLWSSFLPSSFMADFTKAMMLGHKNHKKKLYVGTIAFARVCGVLCLLLFTLLFARDYFNELRPGLYRLFSIVIIVVFSFLAILISFQKKRFGSTFSLLKKLNRKGVITCLLYSCLLQFLGIFSFYAMLLAYGANIDLSLVLALHPLVVVVTMLPASIGGLGLREVSSIMIYGKFTELEPSVLIQASISIYLVSLLMGGMGLLITNKDKSNLSNKEK